MNRIKEVVVNGSNHGIATTMRMVPTMLTVDLALQLLEELHPNQRSSKKGKINALACDLDSGRGRFTHQPLGIDEDGYTIDGQNRCHAVIKSGKPLKVWICYNVPRTSNVVTDTGGMRTANDAAKIAGVEIPKSTYVSTARQMMAGLKLKREAWSVQQTLDLVATYR